MSHLAISRVQDPSSSKREARCSVALRAGGAIDKLGAVPLNEDIACLGPCQSRKRGINKDPTKLLLWKFWARPTADALARSCDLVIDKMSGSGGKAVSSR